MSLRNYRLRDYDFKIILFAVLLSVIGVFAISSAMGDTTAGAENVKKQIGGIIFGSVMMIITSLIDYHFIMKFRVPIYLLTIFILVLVMVIGSAVSASAIYMLANQKGQSGLAARELGEIVDGKLNKHDIGILGNDIALRTDKSDNGRRAGESCVDLCKAALGKG